MTTPSTSIELQNTTTLAPIDARNTSLDSFSDEHLQVGLSTVPNQFCTKRDALELRKLLVLSQGTRGGVVPSSSAVMDMYMVGKVVGVGSYGKVRAAWHRLTGAKVAIKTYDKAKLKDPAHWKRVASEIKIMEQISHPRIARIYGRISYSLCSPMLSPLIVCIYRGRGNPQAHASHHGVFGWRQSLLICEGQAPPLGG